MKKRNVVVIVLVLALLLMGSAYALWTDSVSVQVTAQSATMDVQIVGRTGNITPPSGVNQVTELANPVPATINDANPTDAVEETLTNFIPGDTVTLTYNIENRGSIDVVLTGVNITFAGSSAQALRDDAVLTWTITEYVGAASGDSATGTGHLNSITTSVDTSGAGVELDGDAATDDYCVLTLVLTLDDNGPLATMEETVFTVTPVYTQK